MGSQKRLGRRLEEVARAVAVGYKWPYSWHWWSGRQRLSHRRVTCKGEGVRHKGWRGGGYLAPGSWLHAPCNAFVVTLGPEALFSGASGIFDFVSFPSGLSRG